MRVIAGTARGKIIKTVKGNLIRPTASRVKEAVFNMVANRIGDSTVLDLFSAAGALGIEALSRGSKKCIFVDNNPRCVRLLKENLQKLKFTGEIIKKNVSQALEQLAGRGIRFDIVFADPPYNKDLAKNLLSQLARHDILTALTIIIIEHSKREIPLMGDKFVKVKERRYGETIISIYTLA